MMADTLGLAYPCCWTLLLQRCVSLVQQVIAPSELLEKPGAVLRHPPDDCCVQLACVHPCMMSQRTALHAAT